MAIADRWLEFKTKSLIRKSHTKNELLTLNNHWTNLFWYFFLSEIHFINDYVEREREKEEVRKLRVEMVRNGAGEGWQKECESMSL